MAIPRIVDDPAYRDLRADDFKHFQEHIAGRKQIDFSSADLRGLDLRNVDMEGCSLHGAHISGTYFPANLSPQEIANSVQYGTRMRIGV